MPLKLTTYYQGTRFPNYRNQYIPLYGIVSHLRSDSGIYSFAYCSIGKTEYLLPSYLPPYEKVYAYFHPPLSNDVKYMVQESILMKQSTRKLFSVICYNGLQMKLRDAFLIEFRNLENSLFGYKVFRNNQYFAINWLRVRNSLHNVEQAEVRFSPSRIRQIKKGLKNGAKVKEAHTPKKSMHLQKCYTIITQPKYGAIFPAWTFQQLEKQMTLSRRAVFLL